MALRVVSAGCETSVKLAGMIPDLVLARDTRVRNGVSSA